MGSGGEVATCTGVMKFVHGVEALPPSISISLGIYTWFFLHQHHQKQRKHFHSKKRLLLTACIANFATTYTLSTGPKVQCISTFSPYV